MWYVYVLYNKNVFRNVYIRHFDITESHLCHFDILFIVVFYFLVRMSLNIFIYNVFIYSHFDVVALPFISGIYIFDRYFNFCFPAVFHFTHFNQLSPLFNHAIIDTVINVCQKINGTCVVRKFHLENNN